MMATGPNYALEFSRLVRRAKRLGITQQAIAHRLEMCRASVTKRLCGAVPTGPHEVDRVAAMLTELSR